MTVTLDVDSWLAEPARTPHRRVRLHCADGDIAVHPLPHGAASDGRLALPAPINAHDHGYGIRTLDFGAHDDALEPWIAHLRLRPPTDPGLEALVAFCRMALAGCAGTMHCHNSLNLERLPEEAAAVIAAARTVGIRLGLSCPLLDASPFVYGGIDALAGTVPDADIAWLSERAPRPPPVSEQIATVEHIARQNTGPLVDIQFGPIGPQWCSNALLEAIADASALSGRRIHMHLLESPRQRTHLDARFPQGIVAYLDEIGFLSDRLTIAHGVQLRPPEIERLAERGVRLATNPSANLRLRSGILPDMAVDGGMPWAVGLDGTGLDDDQDIWREMRLFAVLHNGNGLSPAIAPADIFTAASQTGPAIIGAPPGADVVAVDWPALARDALFDERQTPQARLLGRMRAEHVTDLVVAGRAIVEGGRLRTVDFPAARQELASQARARSAGFDGKRTEAARIARIVRAHYRAIGHP
ncbi:MULTISPECIES: amidohydrolase family protein [unclassified Roseitalea]|uniref:amidohydrolase family protein n=1 Tax=unclassified Roseitalea TaxID=2639107 RepID=UPI00273F28EB|nr:MULTISPECIES: amidohydrolase family protein [unclassified Roseitalea]